MGSLSPREREQRSLRGWKLDRPPCRSRAANVRTVRTPNQRANGLPLPEGEGRGLSRRSSAGAKEDEGKRDSRRSAAWTFAGVLTNGGAAGSWEACTSAADAPCPHERSRGPLATCCIRGESVEGSSEGVHRLTSAATAPEIHGKPPPPPRTRFAPTNLGASRPNPNLNPNPNRRCDPLESLDYDYD